MEFFVNLRFRDVVYFTFYIYKIYQIYLNFFKCMYIIQINLHRKIPHDENLNKYCDNLKSIDTHQYTQLDEQFLADGV